MSIRVLLVMKNNNNRFNNDSEGRISYDHAFRSEDISKFYHIMMRLPTY